MSQKPGAVIHLPLENLWDENGLLDAQKVRAVTAKAIKALLRQKPVRFVVADRGHPLRWVESRDCFTFWSVEVKPHLHEEAKHYLDDYPDGYFYLAYEWMLSDGETVVVLEMNH